MYFKIFLLLFAVIFITGCSFDSESSMAPIAVPSSASSSLIYMTPGTVYVLDTEKSFISWKGSTMIGVSRAGKIKLTKGEFEVSQKNLNYKDEEQNKTLTGELEVDMNSLVSDENLSKLEDHLKDKDFFNVKQFPIGKFKMTNMHAGDAASETAYRYQVAGELILKGVAHPIVVPISITDKNDVIEVTGNVSIDRTAWGIGEVGIGDRALKKDVELNLYIIFKKIST